MTRARPPRHLTLLAILALAALALPGCTGRSGDTVDPLQTLRSRPTLEHAEQDYLAMITEMRTAISTAAPHLTWNEPHPVQDGGSLCPAPYTDVPGARTARYHGGWGIGGIPDSAWPAASQAVIDIAARHGFTHVVRMVDTPGHHALSIHDVWGSQFELGTVLDATLALYGGCFLTAQAHPGPAPSAS